MTHASKYRQKARQGQCQREKIVHDWEQDGAIGSSHPKTKKKAVKQAVAISLKKAGKSKYQQKGAKH